MDLILDELSCDSSLPLSIVGSTFKLTCNGRKRCSLSGDYGLAEGQFILNGVEDTGMENGDVIFSGSIETESSTFEFDAVMADLCNYAVEENLYGDGGNGDDAYQNDDNGDDAYQNGDDANNANDAYYAYDDDNTANNGDDANSYYNSTTTTNNDDNNNNNNNEPCELVDGMYNFSTEFRIPQAKGTWGDSGWTATGHLIMRTYNGEQVGSCEASFTTQSHVGFSSKTVFFVLVPISGVILFLLTYLTLRMVMRNNRDLRHGDLTYTTFCHGHGVD